MVDEFGQLLLILIRFREWKYNFHSSYEQAYIPFCLPKLLAPCISLQLMLWNPLDSLTDVHLHDMPVFKNILFYGNNEVKTFESDILLMPQLVELIVIPKLTGIVKYNMYTLIIFGVIVSFCEECMGSIIFVSNFIISQVYYGHL